MSSMIRSTFVHLPRIGRETERRLWRAGVRDWSDLAGTVPGRRSEVAVALDRSERALSEGDVSYFFERLPPAERWRLLTDFGSRFASVDIETTGLSVYDRLTIVGVEVDGIYRVFVDGADFDEFRGVLEDADGLITFNGSLFDLRFLRRTFPELRLPVAHLDLRFLGRRVGLRGSLKAVEREAGLDRPGDVRSLGGYEATVLWSRFRHGDTDALERLVRYNAADTWNLRPLANLILARLRDQLVAGTRDEKSSYLPGFGAEYIELQSEDRSRRASPALPTISHRSGWLVVGETRVPIPSPRRAEPSLTIDHLLRRIPDAASRIVGIDLTGSEARQTGWAVLEGNAVSTGLLGSTEEIVSRTIEAAPALVSIDSPLSLPLGRDCTRDDCACRRFGITRGCERELRRRGINVYPCLIPSMQNLTRRGIEIAQRLRETGIEVIESYPGAAQDIMGIPRKRASLDQLRAGLVGFGIRDIRPLETITHDELDAITSAVVGTFYLSGLVEPLGSLEEGQLIVPLADKDLSAAVQSPMASTLSREQVPVFLGTPAAGDAPRVNDCGTVAPLAAP